MKRVAGRGGSSGRTRLRAPLAALCAAVASAVALAVATPAADAFTLQPIGTFVRPVYVTSDPIDPDRLFVVEQRGTIQLVTPGGTSTFLDISDLVRSPVGDCCNEQGLFSVAFPPDFDATNHFYVDYTGKDGGAIHVDEFTANGDAAVPASRRPLLTIPQTVAELHNGGQLQFGPDGLLYISVGDGGTEGGANSQNLDSLLGKILRIDPHTTASGAYSVPAGNPLVGVPGADEIWSWGLRNPWRFSFDRLTAALVIGDVGETTREEIDWQPPDAGLGRGVNFGWPCREGSLSGANSMNVTCPPPLTDPVFDYPHGSSPCYSITGGYVSRDAGDAPLYGRYVYEDLCGSEIHSLIPGNPATDDRSEGVGVVNATSFGEDACGRLYIASLGGGVSRLAGGGDSGCIPPRTLTVATGGSGAGSVSGPGISCPGDCSARFANGASLTLTATPAERSRTAAWSAPCAGATTSCMLTMGSDTTVAVDFELAAGGASGSQLTLHAKRRRVRDGLRAALTARVRPCGGRAGDLVRLLEDGHAIEKRRLDHRCRAAFHPRIESAARFRAKLAAGSGQPADLSRIVRIREKG